MQTRHYFAKCVLPPPPPPPQRKHKWVKKRHDSGGFIVLLKNELEIIVTVQSIHMGKRSLNCVKHSRMKGDKIGNCTHINDNKWTSKIDYSLCNKFLYKRVANVLVLPINELSDYSKISTVLISSPSSNRTIGINYKLDLNGVKRV